jgi:predicted PurR-regulated permease PerM
MSNSAQPLGEPGKPLNRRSPFFVSLAASTGAVLTIGVVYLIVLAADMLMLVALAFFVAVGLDPIVSLFARGMARSLAVTAVVVSILGLLTGFLAAVIGLLSEEGTELVRQVGQYRGQLNDEGTTIGWLNTKLHLADLASSAVSGVSVLETVTAVLVVSVLTVYFLADLPRLRRVLFRLVPASRRPRAILIGDEIFAKVGAYLLGNVVLSLIAGACTFAWCVSLGVPYPLLLAITVALLDLVPVVGALTAGVLVSLLALTVSVPVCLATIGFLVAYQIVEDYVLLPKIIGKVVDIPAVVTLVAILIGGVLLGVAGVLVAVPIAAAVLLVLREVCFPRLDKC